MGFRRLFTDNISTEIVTTVFVLLRLNEACTSATLLPTNWHVLRSGNDQTDGERLELILLSGEAQTTTTVNIFVLDCDTVQYLVSATQNK